MTMRLDIMTNDAGELVRREHARELGAGVVVAIYRLAKLAQMHDLGNQAFVRQLDQTHQLIGEYCLRSGSNVSVLFADKATFVAGQLLKGSRGAYEAAAELGGLLERLGGSELHVAREVSREDLKVFAEAISQFHRTGNVGQMWLPPTLRLRQVADAARLRGIDLEDLTPDQRIVRAYASAVVIMRRFFEDLAASRYVLPRRIKRIAQSLVDLSDASTASFLGVTEVRNANYDEAGRAVNTAIVAVAIAREAIQDRATLAQIAMAAMMHDVARPRALALAAADGAPMPGMAGPTMLSEDQEDRLAAGAAAVLTALGRVNEPSITRTVLTYEALWLRRRTWLGAVYWGARPPTLHATIIAVARRYNDLLTPEPGLAPPTTDHAVATLAGELTEIQDRTVLRMLVSALGLLPTGTLVQLSTGEVAEVSRGARGLGDKPRVKIVTDASGVGLAEPVDVELARDATRTVARVLGVDGWRKGLEAPEDGEGDGGAPADAHVDDEGGAPAEPHVDAASEAASFSEPPSSASFPSFGSSPSAVAGAMGKVLGGPLPPPAPREPDRTLFQAQGAAPRRFITPARREPAARGDLGATPLTHVLVYMLDHALTGSIVFDTSEGAEDAIYFIDGVPAKVRVREQVALIGEVLADVGLVDRQAAERAVDGARRLGILLGEYLVGHDLTTRESLAWALEVQLLRRIARLASLAPTVGYAYFRNADMLDGWGGDVALGHGLSPILTSVRHHRDRARIQATLQRIGKLPLSLHPEADLSKLAVLPEEQPVLDVMRSEAMPLAQLLARKLAAEEVVSSLVYTFAVTRQFAFKGQKQGPMAVQGAATRGGPAESVAPPSPMRPKAPSGNHGPASQGAPALRAPAVAARPVVRPVARPGGPGARPLVARRSGGGSAPVLSPNARPTPPSIQRPPPALASDVEPGRGAPRPGDASSDDARTIAMASPSLAAMVARTSRAPAAQSARASAPDAEEVEPPETSGMIEIGEDGIEDAEAALEAMASFRLAEGALQRDDVAGAEQHAKRAVEGDPTQLDYVVLLAWIRALGGGDQPITDAIRTMSKVLLEDPSNERALLYRGRLLLKADRLPEALIDLSELVSANPHHEEAKSELSRVKARMSPV